MSYISNKFECYLTELLKKKNNDNLQKMLNSIIRHEISFSIPNGLKCCFSIQWTLKKGLINFEIKINVPNLHLRFNK